MNPHQLFKAMWLPLLAVFILPQPASAQTLTFGTQTIPAQAYTVGITIDPLTLPAATGGSGISYALQPDPPAGMLFDAGTRVLSGTPNTAVAAAYTYTAANASSGMNSPALTFTITVSNISVSNLGRPIHTGAQRNILEVGDSAGEADNMAEVGQCFTTGASNGSGFTLSNIRVRFGHTTAGPGPIAGELWTGTGSTPTAMVSGGTFNPSKNTPDREVVTFTPGVPGATAFQLRDESTYCLVLSAPEIFLRAQGTAHFRVERTLSTAEDAGATAGWSIANMAATREQLGEWVTAPTVGGVTVGIAQIEVAATANPPGLLSIVGAASTEGDSGSTGLTFTVTLSRATRIGDPQVTVRYATMEGSASAGDFAAASGILTFAAGQERILLIVDVTGDAIVEASETFSVNLSNANRATIVTAAATGTIRDNDAATFTLSAGPTAGVTEVEVVEGGATRFCLATDSPREVEITARFNTRAGSATSGSDYRPLSDVPAVFPTAGRVQRCVDVQTILDSVPEPNGETFLVEAAGAPGNERRVGSDRPLIATATIVDRLGFGSEMIDGQTYARGTMVSVTLPPVPAATGGRGAKSYTLTPAALPGGLLFDGNTRVLSGVPATEVTAAEYIYTAVDASAATTNPALRFTITVNPPLGFGGQTIAAQVYAVDADIGAVALPAATGGIGAGSYTLEPEPPDGLSFNGTTGVLSGTPTTVMMAAEYTYTAVDASEGTPNPALRFTITVNPALGFGGQTIPDQEYAAGTAIDDLILPTATGGLGDRNYTLEPSLPAGLFFDAATRVLSGVPTTAMTAAYTYTAVDASDATANPTLIFTITVNPALGFGGQTIPDQLYAADNEIVAPPLPAATGGIGARSYTLQPLPAGLSFNGLTRVLSGTPTTVMTAAEYVYTAVDASAATPNPALTFTITVNPPLSFGAQTIDDRVYAVGAVIADLTLPTATGGIGTGRDYTLMPETLPLGLSFNADARVLSGTPRRVATVATYVYTAIDGSAITADPALRFTITVIGLAVTISGFNTADPENSANMHFATGTGIVLTANVSGDTGGAVNYSWFRGVDADGDGGTNVGASTNTYTAVDDDHGYRIGVEAMHRGVAVRAAVPVGIRPPAPTGVSIDPPAVIQGGVLTARSVCAPILPFHQWLRAGAVIDGQTQSVHTTTAPGMHTVRVSCGYGSPPPRSVRSIAVESAAATVEMPLSFGGMSIGSQLYTINIGVGSVTLPAAVGGIKPLSYTLEPALPAGLSFTATTSTGILSGTPATLVAATAYTYTVTDSDRPTASAASLSFTIAVQPQPQLSITAPPPVIEGSVVEGGGPVAEFTVTLSRASVYPVTVGYATRIDASDTAESNDLFFAPAGTLSFAPGDTSKTLAVEINGDVIVEDDETFSVVLSAPVNATLSVASATAVGTIADDDSARVVLVANPAARVGMPIVVTEDAGTIMVYVRTIAATLERGISVAIMTNDGTATAGADYAAVNASLTIAARGRLSSRGIVIFDDDAPEDDETFSVTISRIGNDPAVRIGTADSLTVTISRNDYGFVRAVDDQAYSIQVPIPALTLPPAKGGVSPLSYVLSGRPGGLSFDAGTRVLSGAAIRNGTFSLTYTATDSSTPALTASLSFTATVTDLPLLSIADESVVEGNSGRTALSFTASMNRGGTQRVTVIYATTATAADTAMTGDFTATTGTVTLETGERSASFAVFVTGDAILEYDETFSVILTSATGAEIGTRGAATATIEDDDTAIVTLSASSATEVGAATVAEDAGTAAVYARTATVLERGISVAVATGDGTAVAGADYMPVNASLTIAAGTMQSIGNIVIVNDDRPEDDETFVATVSRIGNDPVVMIGTTSSVTLTIGRNDFGFIGAVAALTYARGTAIAALTLPATRGGTPPLSYVLSNRPAGLLFDRATGVLSGTPMEEGTFVMASTATDVFNLMSRPLTLTITVNPALNFGMQTIDDQLYVAGTAITDLALPVATGGLGGKSYALSPPDGLLFNDDTRVLSGAPMTAAPAATYVYTAADSTGSISLSFTITVNEALSFAMPDIAGADLTYAVNTAITVLTLPAATGGLGILSYALSPELPDGLSYDNTIRVLSGTPMTAVSETAYTYTVTDLGSPASSPVSLSFTITVNPVLNFAMPAPGAQTYAVGTAITDLTLPQAAGGLGAKSYALSPTPPDGLSFNGDTRALSGTPMTVVSEAAYTYTATDPTGSVSLSFTIAVNPALSFAMPAPGAQTYVAGTAIADLALPEATGGVGDKSYTLSPEPPDGLSFNGATRTLSGTPMTAMSETAYTYTATDPASPASSPVSLSFTITVNPALDFGQTIADRVYAVGTSIAALVLPEATGGIGVRSYALSPEPPDGLSYDAATRVLSGTPTAVTAETAYTYTATDLGSPASSPVSLSFTITVNPALNFGMQTITTQTYAVGTSITALVLPAAAGGIGARSYALSPELPDGLSYDTATRVLSGTPTTVTTETAYIYTATDTGSPTTSTVSLRFTITVNAALGFGMQTITTRTYAVGTAIADLALPEATGGLGDKTYALSPAPPDGLSFNAATRVLSGTPRAVTTETAYIYTATDTGSPTTSTVSLRFTITVNAALGFGAETIADQTYAVGTAITDLTLPAATGGVGARSYTLSPALPGGLSFNAAAARVLSGTPMMEMAETTYVYTVTDSAGPTAGTASLSFTITVNAALGFGAETIDNQAYIVDERIPDLTLPEATGGIGARSYALSPALPVGLTFNASGMRVLSGAPTMEMSETAYTYTATDTASPAAATLTFTITVSPAGVRLRLRIFLEGPLR